MNESQNLKDLIRENADDVKSMTVDGVSHTNRSLDELIKADEHLKQNEAAGDPASAIKMFRIRGNSMR